MSAQASHAAGSADPARPGTLRRVQVLYREHVMEKGRESRLLVAAAFFITFGLVRLITHSIRDHRFTFLFHNVGSSSGNGLHVHHMVFGIAGLMVVGYVSIALRPRRAGVLRLLSLALGICLALTLDEFALWLNLKDVYWQREGQESVDAALFVGSVIGIAASGRGLFIAMAKDVRTLWRDARKIRV